MISCAISVLCYAVVWRCFVAGCYHPDMMVRLGIPGPPRDLALADAAARMRRDNISRVITVLYYVAIELRFLIFSVAPVDCCRR